MGSALTPLKFGVLGVEEISKRRHCGRMGSQPSVENIKWVSLIGSEMSFHAYLWMIFLLRVGVFLKNSESGRRYTEPCTEGLPHICPLLTFIQTFFFVILTRPMWIQAKPLPIFLGLLSTKTQNVHGFFPHLSHFSLSNPVFPMFNFITIILPSFTSTSFEEPNSSLLSDSHWISHIPFSKAPLQQVLDKQ